MTAVGRGSDQFNLRFPDGLRDKIKRTAVKNFRSMNAEIISTLEKAYGSEGSAAEASAPTGSSAAN